MIEEMEEKKKNDTWELITLPRGKRTVGCRWVYTLKHKADGSIERARIVAKGFTQTYGIDYLETFAPVAKLNSIPYESFCQLQLTDLGHCISSMSKSPFFMETSTNRFIWVLHQVFERRVFRWKKAIYGLKQSPRAWFEIWSLVMTKIDGFPEKECWSFRVHKKETRGNYCSPSVLSLFL